MFVRKTAVVFALVLFLSNSPHAYASLINNLNGTITQTRQDGTKLMWLQDANFAKTSGFDADGQILWADAMSWASGLTFAGYTGWRLPTTPNFTGGSGGYNTNSEFGQLYYGELGNTAGSFVNAGPFFNIQTYWYWTDKIFEDPNYAMVFLFRETEGKTPDFSGWEDAGDRINGVTYAWLVRDATNDPVVAPEPGILPLCVIGLSAMALSRRRLRVNRLEP